MTLLLLLLLLLPLATSNTVQLQAASPAPIAPVSVKEPIKFTIFPHNFDMASKGTPWLTLEHGYNHIAFDGWTCQGSQSLSLKYWQNPQAALPPGPAPSSALKMSSAEIRMSLKSLAGRKGVKLLVNAFSSFQNPVTNNQSASECANSLAKFIDQNNLDGANLDFRDE